MEEVLAKEVALLLAPRVQRYRVRIHHHDDAHDEVVLLEDLNAIALMYG